MQWEVSKLPTCIKCGNIMNYWLLTIACVLCLLVGGGITHFVIDKPIIVKETSTVFRDTGKVKQGELKIVKVQKPISIMQLDSIYNEAKKWAIENTPHDIISRPIFGLFTVSHDTAFTNADSTVELEVHNEVSSMLPFYKPGFNDKYIITSKPKTITINTYNPSFFQRFQPAIFGGFGIDPLRSQLGVYLGIGMAFTL